MLYEVITLTMIVEVLPKTDSLIDTVICVGTPEFAWNGLTIVSDMDSSYQTILTNSFGCDSLLTLNVTVVPPVVIVEDTTLCVITSYSIHYTKLYDFYR